MNRITKMWKDTRWRQWLICFLAGLGVVAILSFVGWVAQHDREISELRIDLREANKKIESISSIVDIATGVEEIKQKEK